MQRRTLEPLLPDSSPGRRRRAGWLLGIALLSVGCGGAVELEPFQPSRRSRELLADDAPALAAVTAQLERLFGQPNDPHLGTAPLADGFDPGGPSFGEGDERLLDAIRLDNSTRYFDFLRELEALGESGSPASLTWPSSLARIEAVAEGIERTELRRQVEEFHPTLGESAQSFARQCVLCHGVSGDGGGPGAQFQNPPPRDYGAAEFSQFPAALRERPRHGDLIRVLQRGIASTSMPRFSSRPASELSGLSDYVRYLAVRGEVERALVDLAADGKPLDDGVSDREFERAIGRWRAELSGNDPGVGDSQPQGGNGK